MRPNSIFGLVVQLGKLYGEKLSRRLREGEVSPSVGACGIVALVLAMSSMCPQGGCPFSREGAEVGSATPHCALTPATEEAGVSDAERADAEVQLLSKLGSAIVDTGDHYLVARRADNGEISIASVNRRGRVNGSARTIGTDAEVGPVMVRMTRSRYVIAWSSEKRVHAAVINQHGRALTRTSLRQTARVLRLVADASGFAVFGTQRRRLLNEVIWFARFDARARKQAVSRNLFSSQGATTFDVAAHPRGYELVAQHVTLRHRRDPPELQRLVVDPEGKQLELERLADGVAWDIRVARGHDELGVFWQRPIHQRGLCFGTHPSTHQATCETRLAMHPSLAHSTHGFGAAWSERAAVRFRVGTNETRLSPIAGVHISPNVARDGDGFVVTWEERIRGEVWMRRVRANGEPYGAARKIAF